MSYLAETRTLTLQGAQHVVQAAMPRAVALGQPMCIAVVDAERNSMAFARMDGAKALSVISSTNEATTAALSAAPTDRAHADVELQVAHAHECKWTHLIGGLPIKVGPHVIGAVAAGSGIIHSAVP